MTYQNLEIETRDGVAVVKVNRPEKRNALNLATMVELGQAFAALEADPEVRGVIVTGSGDRAFVAGADIQELAALTPESGRDLARRGQAVFDRIERLGKPVVAAINGYALGGGCELALACHVRVAADTAMLATPEVKLGLMCGYGGTQRLARLVGRGRALEILLTGEMVTAAEAFRIGLVNRVVAPGTVVAEAEALLRKMLANGPLSLRLTLEAVSAGLDMPLSTGLEHEAALFGLLCTTEDMKEGTRAFLEKRPARFQGK
jgi:enoyl-CoA hydratase